ncbi:MAG: hypothetical protein H0X33_11815 [Taibaiella sp.]|nr:hypothetical protein [Taibaiella sp.]
MNINGAHEVIYRMVFTDSAGLIKGYTITESEQVNETKTLITGTIDHKKNLVSFRETKMVYTHAPKGSGPLCYVQAQLSFTNYGTGMVMQGKFTGKTATGKPCGTGTITLYSKTGEDRDLDNIDKSVPPVSPIAGTAPVAQPVVVPPADTLISNDVITSGKDNSYTWLSDTLKMDVWDGSKEDGDIITISFNGIPILEHFTIKNAKRRINIPIHPGRNTVTILAENVGTEEPNTADIMLIDGNRQYKISAYNNKGKTALFTIVK